MTRLLFSLCALLTLMACSSSSSDKGLQTIPVADHFNRVEQIALDDFGKTVKYVQLETNDDILIRYIGKVIMTNDRLIVMHDNLCSVFDLDGNYLYRIGSRGEGPNKYLDMTDVFVMNDVVYIHDSSRENLLQYSMSGEIKDVIKTPMRYSNLFKLSDGNMFGYKDNISGQEKMMGYVWDGNILLDSIPNIRLYETSPIIMYMYNVGVVYSLDNKDYYKNILNDTIYQLTADYDLRPHYFLDQGKYRVDEEKRYTFTNPRHNIFSDMGSVNMVCESKDYLFFTIYIEGTKHYCWDKRDNTLHNVQFTYPPHISDDTFFAPKYLSEDKRYLMSDLVLDDSEDNPIIVIVEL